MQWCQWYLSQWVNDVSIIESRNEIQWKFGEFSLNLRELHWFKFRVYPDTPPIVHAKRRPFREGKHCNYFLNTPWIIVFRKTFQIEMIKTTAVAILPTHSRIFLPNFSKRNFTALFLQELKLSRNMRWRKFWVIFFLLIRSRNKSLSWQSRKPCPIFCK